ncbi:MAG TPA: ECF-type sigma factor [Candidatus Acidoferrales bacterium]|nr:ECF-type sigma factor [Candidatus Acidoferrales bacterium]
MQKHVRAREGICPGIRPHPISKLLADWGRGDEKALDALITVVYNELRRIPRRICERSVPTTPCRAQRSRMRRICGWPVSQHRSSKTGSIFSAWPPQLIRRILLDYARNRLAAERGAGATRFALDPDIASPGKADVDLLALDAALGKLSILGAQQGRLVELRFFGGLSIEETAAVLEVSSTTVKRERMTARAWLKRELKRNAEA